jgi:beta-phosphoglucomutase
MKIPPRALIFDLNGTMINDMEFHIQAWTYILNEELNAGLTQDQVKTRCMGRTQNYLSVFLEKGK